MPLAAAAAAVIGANVGTTSTAAIAVVGATPNAKRVAAAHVLFNMLTCMVAFVILPLLLRGVAFATDISGLEHRPAVTLALFHTTFNIFGVLLMWPLTPRLVHMLERRFRSIEEDMSRPQYLDKNVLATPTLALDAVALELARIGGIARNMGKAVLSAEQAVGVQLVKDKQAVAGLVAAVGQFSVAMQRGNLPAEFDQSLPDALRVARYYTAVAELADDTAQVQRTAGYLADEALNSEMVYFRSDAVKLLDVAEPARDDYDVAAIERILAALEDSYHSLKAHLLRAGAAGRIGGEQIVQQLEIYSRLRRMLQQAVKGANYLHGLLQLAAKYRRMQQEDVRANT